MSTKYIIFGRTNVTKHHGRGLNPLQPPFVTPVSRGRQRIRKGWPLKRTIYAMEKEVNGRLNTTITTTQRVYRILETVFEFVVFQMAEINVTQTCKKFNF